MKRLFFREIVFCSIVVANVNPSLGASLVVEAHKKSCAHSEMEGPYVGAHDHIDLIKQWLAKSSFRVTEAEWRNDSQKVANASYCLDSAAAIVECFTGERANEVSNRAQHVFEAKREAARGEIRSLRYTSPWTLLVHLKNLSSFPHTLYLLYGPYHAFVLEKKSEGGVVWWRIYQAYLRVFTLTHWCGVDNWPTRYLMSTSEHWEAFKQAQALVGQGRWITQKKLIEYFEDDYFFPKRTLWYVRVFEVPSDIYQSIAKRLGSSVEVQQSSAARELVTHSADVSQVHGTISNLTMAAGRAFVSCCQGRKG